MGCSAIQPSRKHRARAQAAHRAVSPQRTRDAEAALDQPSVLQRPCPCCGGRMIVIETLGRGCQRKHAATPVPQAMTIDASSCRHRRTTVTTLAILAGAQPATKLASVPLDWPVVAPQIPSYNVRTACSPRCPHPRFEANRPRQPLLSPRPLKARRRQMPLTRTPYDRCATTRFRALALFNTFAVKRVDSLCISGVRKPAHQETFGAACATLR